VLTLAVSQEHQAKDVEQLLVVFSIAQEFYAAPIFQVREVIKLPKTIKIPQSPHFVEGVMNIRGKVIPVINLKKRLNLSHDEVDEKARVMIVELTSQNAGLIVDQVSEVVRITPCDIKEAPKMTSVIDNQYIKGVVYHKDRMLILLDLNRIFSSDEQEDLLLLAEG
jgi:purine-binding chemotaxis protein CheW